MVARVDHADARSQHDIGRRDGARPGLLDPQQRVLETVIETECESLEVANDLMDILDDAGNRLMLVDDAIDPKRPHRGAPERRQEHPPHGVAQRVSEAALERLEAELGDVWIVFALRRFDELRSHEAPEIDRLCHLGDPCVGHAGRRAR